MHWNFKLNILKLQIEFTDYQMSFEKDFITLSMQIVNKL